MAVKYFSAEISGRQVTMYNDHYALVQQYNRPEPLQSNIANEQRRMRMMGELSYRGVKLVRTPGRENPLAGFLSRMNQDQNCPIFQEMQHQLQETPPAGTSQNEHSQACVNNRAQRQDAAAADRSVNLATSVADHQPDDEGVCSINCSNSNKTATALAQCDLTYCNVPLVKTAANTSLPHEAAIACQHFHALPFCHADNSIQQKSTFPSKETQQNILIGYTLPHDQNILTNQRLQLDYLAQAQAKSMHKLDELLHANLHFEKELITGIPLWTYRAGKQPAKLWIPLRNAN